MICTKARIIQNKGYPRHAVSGMIFLFVAVSSYVLNNRFIPLGIESYSVTGIELCAEIAVCILEYRRGIEISYRAIIT